MGLYRIPLELPISGACALVFIYTSATPLGKVSPSAVNPPAREQDHQGVWYNGYMPNIQLSDDDFYWVCVAIENCKESAVRLSNGDPDDPDVQDCVELADTWTRLQGQFPPPELITKAF